MVVYTSPTTLPIDLPKRRLMLYAIMIFITQVWSSLCKLTSKEFWPNSTRPCCSCKHNTLRDYWGATRDISMNLRTCARTYALTFSRSLQCKNIKSMIKQNKIFKGVHQMLVRGKESDEATGWHSHARE